MKYESQESNLVKAQQGTEGQPGASAYVHIKFSNDGGATFTGNNGEDPGEYLGQYTDNISTDSSDPSDYSWVKVVGADGYTILLTNENISFSTDKSRKVTTSQNYKCEVICMQGTVTRTDFSVDTVSPPSPLTASVSNHTITISVAAGSSFDSDTGQINVPIMIDEKTVIKQIAYSLSKEGKDGQIGHDGKPAVVGQLSNDYIGIPTDADGNNGVYTNARSTLYIYEGTTDVSADWTCTASASTGITGSLSGKTYSITNMTTDTGTVTLTAKRSGYSDVVKKIVISKNKAGKTGPTGASARIYMLTPSSLVLKRDDGGTYSPSSIIFYGYYRNGQSTEQIAYAGRFKIEESVDGREYTVKYTSSTNENNVVYTPNNNVLKAVRCTLYAAGGTSQVLDIQSIVVLEDIDPSAFEEEIEHITSTMTTISSTVDAINNKITNMVTQSDIDTAINKYDGSTVKTIRDRVSKTEQDISGLTSTVSDIKSTFEGDIQSLSTQMSKLEQDATQFKTTVSATYSTKQETSQAKTDAINSANANTDEKLKSYSTTAQMNSAIDQKADSITTTVSSTYATKTDVETKFETATSQYTQLSNKFSWIVKSGTSESNFTITDRLIELTSDALDIDALVTFKNQANAGTATVINGGAIDTDSLFARTITATGSITGGTFIGSIIKSPNNDTVFDLSAGTINIGNGKLIFDGTNLSISGQVTASSGTIGGFTIGDIFLANGTTSIASGDESVYLGTDGISCGTQFKVDKYGSVTAYMVTLPQDGGIFINDGGIIQSTRYPEGRTDCHLISWATGGIQFQDILTKDVSLDTPCQVVYLGINATTPSGLIRCATYNSSGVITDYTNIIGGIITAANASKASTITPTEIKSTTMTAGSLTVNNNAKIGGSTSTSFIELSYSTPYVDFHYNNTGNDFSSRIICSGTGLLDLGFGGTWGAIRINANNGTVAPITEGSFSLGGSGHRFYKLWVTQGVDNSSLAELKTDIRPFASALQEIEETDVYNYRLKETIAKEGRDIMHTGFVIGSGYRTSEYLLSPSKEGIDLYSAIGVTFAGVKELYSLVKKQEIEIKELKRKLEQL